MRNPLSAVGLLALLVQSLTPHQHLSVTVVGDATQCRKGASAQVWLVSDGPVPAPLRVVQHVTVGPGTLRASRYLTLVRRSDPNPACRWEFEGLPPGIYLAALETSDGSGGAVTFHLTSAGSARVNVRGPAVVVHGRVLWNARGVAGARVRIESLPFTTPIMDRVADAAGRYSATLATAGKYMLASPVATWKGSLAAESVRVDLAGSGGGLEIDVRETPPARSLTVVLANATSTRARDMAPAQRTLRWFNVPDGTYRVLAYEDNGGLVATTSPAVTIDSRHRDGQVTLELGENDGSVVVAGDGGRPLRDAHVTWGIGEERGATLPPNPFGGFSLRGVPPGGELVARAPGYRPSCRRASLNAGITVVLRHGVPATLVLDQAVRSQLGAITISGVAGAECPIPLSAFQAALRPSAGQEAQLEVSDFPSERPLTFRLRGALLASAEADGIIALRLR
jgi:hypothetical protein